MSDPFAALFLTAGAGAERGDLVPIAAAAARGSISDHVAQRILALVRSGSLKSGDRLPTEQQMTSALGISRPPLREALKALTLMGVLESRQGGRYTVTELSPALLIAPFNMMLSSRAYDPADHYEARSAVDLDCVRLCAERAGPEVRDRILALAEQCFAAIEDPVAFRAIDRDFHVSIYAGSGNVFLDIVARGLFDICLDIRRQTVLLPEIIAVSCEDHRRIAAAIAAGDGPAAVEAYRHHLDHIRDTTIRVLTEEAET